jgi:hypothetical protein
VESAPKREQPRFFFLYSEAPEEPDRVQVHSDSELFVGCSDACSQTEARNWVNGFTGNAARQTSHQRPFFPVSFFMLWPCMTLSHPLAR